MNKTKIERNRAAFAREMGQDPAVLAHLMGISVYEDESDRPVLTPDPEIPPEFLRAEHDPDEALCTKSDILLVRELRSNLTPREQDILHRRFILEQTLDEIGAVHGLKRPRMSEVLSNLLGKLRKQYALAV